MAPSPTGGNGRTSAGQFAPGNKIGTGNPNASKVQKLRAGMLAALEVKDIQAVILTVLDKALDGDLSACKLILTVIGPPTENDTTTSTPEINATNFVEIKNALLARSN